MVHVIILLLLSMCYCPKWSHYAAPTVLNFCLTKNWKKNEIYAPYCQNSDLEYFWKLQPGGSTCYRADCDPRPPPEVLPRPADPVADVRVGRWCSVSYRRESRRHVARHSIPLRRSTSDRRRWSFVVSSTVPKFRIIEENIKSLNLHQQNLGERGRDWS